MTEMFLDLCRYWKTRAAALWVERIWSDYKRDQVIHQVSSYLSSINFYDDIEQEIPNWFKEDMERYFKSLEQLELHGYSK